MPEMNRTTAGHGVSGSPFDWIGKKVSGRLGEMQKGMTNTANQKMEHEHEINKMVTKHVLAKDMHTHISKGAEGGTSVTMDYEGIATGNVKRNKKPRGAQAVTPEEHVETPASSENAASSESAERQQNHSGQGTFVGGNVPTHPGSWSGGWMEHNPKTGRAQTKPGYKEFKARQQHFESGLASQQGHFDVKPGIKIPNYARKAMQPKKGK